MVTSRRSFMATMVGAAMIVPTAKLPTPANLYEHLKSCWTWHETREILHAFPLRKADISSRREAPLTILSDSRRDLMQLNPAAARIWELCDGRNRLDTMVRQVMVDYDTSFGACAHDVLFTLRTFKRRDLISC